MRIAGQDLRRRHSTTDFTDFTDKELQIRVVDPWFSHFLQHAAGRKRVRRSAHETGNRPARPQKPPQFGAIWCKKQPPAQQAGKMAYSAQRAQRFTPRTPPGAGRAAPTVFQRTSLHTKCNTEDGDCKGLARRPRRMTRKGGLALLLFPRVLRVLRENIPSFCPKNFEQKETKATKRKRH